VGGTEIQKKNKKPWVRKEEKGAMKGRKKMKRRARTVFFQSQSKREREGWEGRGRGNQEGSAH